MTEEKKPEAEEAKPAGEVPAEPEAPGNGAEAVEPPAEETAAEEGSLEDEIAALKDQLLRALAEVENTRRRARQEVESANRYAVSNLARDLVSVADNLHRALEAIPADEREKDSLLQQLATGVEMVERELLGIFEKHGIRRIEPLGEKFDHNFHQAMFEVPDAKSPAGTVVQVVAPGYVIHDRLLRPAMVGVAKGGPAAGDDGDSAGAKGNGAAGVDEKV